MRTEDCYYLGYVTKTFGYKGEVVIYLDTDNPGYYKNLESVFILMEGKLIPFFIEKIQLRVNSNEAIIRFQNVDNEQKAEHITGQEAYLPLTMLPPLKGNKFYFHEIIGFQVIDKQKGILGTIDTVLEFPANPVLQIKVESKEVLVPARDEFIIKLDRQNKTITIDAPEGLIDLYLNE
ncbi:MAG: ribosome maturation factor RimM [Bacteroidales bacterium]